MKLLSQVYNLLLSCCIGYIKHRAWIYDEGNLLCWTVSARSWRI